MGVADSTSTNRNNRIICLPFSQHIYESNILNPQKFRVCIDKMIELFPELFPAQIVHGYQMKDINRSKKQPIWIRRIKIAGVAYSIRPSFMMPYLVGYVDKIQAALFLRKFNVPFWAVSYVFVKDPMYWYRIEQSIGKNSLVGTTVKNPEDIPKHLAADEKHTRILGEKTYVATTVGSGCILGAAVAKDAGEQALTDAYQVYKQEAQCIKPEYAPETVNMDGWKATRNAWQTLFRPWLSFAVFYMCLSKYVTVQKRNIEISSKMSQRRYGNVIVPKAKDHFPKESEDWWNGAKIRMRQLSSLIQSRSYKRILQLIKLPMIILKHTEPAIWLTA